MQMFRLDYISCFLTIVATVLVGRRMWAGLVLSGINSLIVCVIGLHTSQYGFIPANMFCVCIYAMSLRSWLKAPKDEPEPVVGVRCEPPAFETPISASANHSPRIVRYFLRTRDGESFEEKASQELNCFSA
jgi:hypothetical protein